MTGTPSQSQLDNRNKILVNWGYEAYNSVDYFKAFVIANDEQGPTTAYVGYERNDGYWYIHKSVISGTSTTHTYASGTTGYAAAWSNRASETYNSPKDVTWP